jgi:hypothetical protein
MPERLRKQDVGGFRPAPGASAPCLMSEVDGLVGAEVFAATSPDSNGKLKADLAKMAVRHEQHRYVFFMSPKYPKAERLPNFERDDVQVWSVIWEGQVPFAGPPKGSAKRFSRQTATI